MAENTCEKCGGTYFFEIDEKTLECTTCHTTRAKDED